MKRSQPALDQLLATQIQVLATTLRPKTVLCYRSAAHNFLAYLHTTFPRLHKLSQLRRNPHLLGWFRFLCQQYPPPRNRIRELHLLTIRRLLRDLADQGHPVTPDLIRHEDFPPHDHYLPRPLPLQEDQHLQQQLRLTDTLETNALRLMRATGIRIGECIALPRDCLQQLSERQVTLHVPLGKLHSERLVPVDEEAQRIVARMVELRALTPIPGHESQAFLPPRYRQPGTWYTVLHHNLAEMARLAGCTSRGQPAPAAALLRHRDGAPRRQPAGAHANAGAQRHPHDLALCGSRPARRPTRISQRSAKNGSPLLHPPTPTSLSYCPPAGRPLYHSPDHRSYPPPSPATPAPAGS
jgi:site-specific recombinase XerD